MEMGVTKKRCSGAGRPPLLGELENLLYDEIIEMRIQKMKVTRSFIRVGAKLMAEESNIADFVASSTWCDNFLRRNHLV